MVEGIYKLLIQIITKPINIGNPEEIKLIDLIN